VDPYALIAQYPNAGQAFTDAFQGGMKQNALANFAQNPGDPKAAGAAARYAPDAVLQYREKELATQAEQQKAALEQWHKTAGAIAKLADTPEKWDQAVDYLVAQGHPEVAQLKGHFSPNLRAQFMALGGEKDDNPAQDPGIIREYDIATQRGLVPQGTTYTQYVAMRNPGSYTPVTVPYNSTVTAGAQQGGGAAPVTATGPNGQKIQLNQQTGQWEPVGGAGGNVSGGFPR
jgi:hypothetical protein